MSSFDPDTGIWLVVDKDSPEHAFDFNLAVALVEVLKFYGVKSIADLGCGLGTYCQLLKLAWFFPVGFDGNPHTESLTDGRCHVLDLSQKIQIGMFDAVLSTEVGEHIPEQYEKAFLDNICKTAGKVLILSWGIPGQDGMGHVNCKENEYIINQVEQRGYKHNQYWSAYLRKQADLSWFKHTIMVFKRTTNA